MLLLLFCLGALATCGLALSSEDKIKLKLLDKEIEHGKPVDETFASFKAIFHKKYKDDKEQTTRKQIFEDNTKLIKDINKKYDEGEKSYYAGINEFADLTHKEFLNHYTGRFPIESRAARNASSLFRRRRRGVLPLTVDWRSEGLVTSVKDQGQCESCWTFSTTGALEGQHKKKTGQLISLSQQQILDCLDGFGCDGGLSEIAFDYIKKYGIEGEADYPYLEMSSTCNYKPALVKATITGYLNIPSGSEASLKEAVANVGPIAIANDANQESFMFYKGGVYDEPNCKSSLYSLNHEMLAVGYGTSSGKDYWLVKNSWGTSWGMSGYIQMSRNKNNQCGIATDAIYPLV